MLNVSIHELELPNPPQSGEKLLYVVLHGLISIVETKEKFLLYLLDMGDDHRYIGGSWLAEKPVAKSAHAVLSGVDAGTAVLDRKANPVVRVTVPPALDTKGVFGIIEAPRPRKLYSLDRGAIKITAGAENLLDTPETLSGIRVLEYAVSGEFDDVKVDGTGFHWAPGSNFTRFSNTSQLATLHIYDMPGKEVGPNHHVDEFALSSAVLGSPIAIDEMVIVHAEDPANRPPGMSKLELTPLDARDEEISDILVDFIRTAVWEPQGAVNSTCRACCGGTDGGG